MESILLYHNFPLRPNIVMGIHNVPSDLTWRESQRLRMLFESLVMPADQRITLAHPTTALCGLGEATLPACYSDCNLVKWLGLQECEYCHAPKGVRETSA